MFEVGWTEMLVIAIVMIVIVGPKDLPRMLRTFGKMTGNMRRMAGDFRKQFDDAMREAELDDIKSSIDSARKLNPASEIKKALNPMEKAAADVRAGLDQMMRPQTPKVPSPDAPAEPAEPLKAGPTAMPGEAAAAPVSTASEQTATAAPTQSVATAEVPAAPVEPAAKAVEPAVDGTNTGGASR